MWCGFYHIAVYTHGPRTLNNARGEHQRIGDVIMQNPAHGPIV